MSTHYFDPATGEWVTRAELNRRRMEVTESLLASQPVEIWPEWLQAKEPQEVEVVESTPTKPSRLSSLMRDIEESFPLRLPLVVDGVLTWDEFYDVDIQRHPGVDDQGDAQVVELPALPPPERSDSP